MSNDPLSHEISSGDRPRCQEDMGVVIAQTRSERASKHSYGSPLLGVNTPRSDEERLGEHELMDNVPPTHHDSSLSGGHTPRSDEGRPNINELMAICINLSNRVLSLEQLKTAQDLVIQKLKKKFKRLGKKLRARTLGMKLIKIDSDFAELDMENVEGDAETQWRNTAEQITTAGDTVNTTSIDVSVAEPSNVSTVEPSTSTARDIFEDKMMTIVDTLVTIRSTRPRTTSVVIHDVKEEPRRTKQVPTLQSQDKGKGKMVEPEPTPKNPIKTWIAREKVAEQEAKDAALIEQMEEYQERIDADKLLAERLQQEERQQFTIKEKSRLLVEIIEKEQKWTNDFVPMDSELEVQRLKKAGQEVLGEKQSAEKEKELSEEELQKLLVVIPVEEVYVEALQIFAEMLKKFDRDDLVKLWDMVKERFSTTEPADDKEKELWVELKRLFEPDSDDTLWKLQRYMHDPLIWRLYDTCGVHHVSLVRGHDIFMLVEKDYPLSKGVLTLMLVNMLLVEVDSEMSRELLRKIFYQANISNLFGIDIPVRASHAHYAGMPDSERIPCRIWDVAEDSKVTYTSISCDDRSLEVGSPGMVVYGYDGILMHPPSPDYVPGPEHLPSPVYVLHVLEPKQAPTSPDFLPEPVYPEFMPPEDDVLLTKKQPLPTVVSLTTDSPGYITESDPKEDPVEDNEDPEEDPANYLTDKDDDDDEEEESSREDADDEEEDEDTEEEEHLALPTPSYHLHVVPLLGCLSEIRHLFHSHLRQRLIDFLPYLLRH
ncbi:hypothetical protein Tco_1184621 [Tanacetum coccineum]